MGTHYIYPRKVFQQKNHKNDRIVRQPTNLYDRESDRELGTGCHCWLLGNTNYSSDCTLDQRFGWNTLSIATLPMQDK